LGVLLFTSPNRTWPPLRDAHGGGVRCDEGERSLSLRLSVARGDVNADVVSASAEKFRGKLSCRTTCIWPPLQKPASLYQTATRRGEHIMSDNRVKAGQAEEDQFTAAIEAYTAPIPSSAYLGLALASIAASITIQAIQKEKANPALFVGQWVAPFLLLGIYNKMVKQHGSDAATRE